MLNGSALKATVQFHNREQKKRQKGEEVMIKHRSDIKEHVLAVATQTSKKMESI